MSENKKNKLSPAAKRALKEADERRKENSRKVTEMPKEIDGPEGPEPTRYGDWEKKGITSDFQLFILSIANQIINNCRIGEC